MIGHIVSSFSDNACVMPNNSSDSPQALPFPFLSRMIHNSQSATGISVSDPAQLMGTNHRPCHNGELSLEISNLNEMADDEIVHIMADERVHGMDGEVGTL